MLKSSPLIHLNGVNAWTAGVQNNAQLLNPTEFALWRSIKYTHHIQYMYAEGLSEYVATVKRIIWFCLKEIALGATEEQSDWLILNCDTDGFTQ